jgi:hypothetical protein
MNRTVWASPFRACLSGLVAVLVLASCQDVTGPVAPEERSNESISDLSFTLQQRYLSTTDEYLAVEKLVPGFGGLYFDEQRRLNVHLTSSARTAASTSRVRSVLAEFFRTRPVDLNGSRLDLQNIVFHDGRRDVARLIELHDEVGKIIGGIPGRTAYGIDYVENRVEVGVQGPELVQEAQSRLIDLGVSEDDVAVRVVPLVHTRSNLRDYHRPVYGGMGVYRVVDGSFRPCSIAANVREILDGPVYYLTASHCTDLLGVVDTITHVQGGLTSNHRLAFERQDPPFFTNADNPACPIDWTAPRCRWSDVSLMEYITPDSRGFAKIAHTPLGSINLGTPDHYVVSHGSNPQVGTYVRKVGAMTGTSHGLVTQVHQNRVLRRHSGRDRAAYWILRATIADHNVADGDSGGALYQLLPDGRVAVLGVLFGGAPTEVYYAPMGNVSQDFGRWFHTAH